MREFLHGVDTIRRLVPPHINTTTHSSRFLCVGAILREILHYLQPHYILHNGKALSDGHEGGVKKILWAAEGSKKRRVAVFHRAGRKRTERGEGTGYRENVSRAWH